MRTFLAGLLLAWCALALAAPAPQQEPPPAAGSTAADQVVVSGTVPDDATKAAVLGKLRSLYGADRVVDQLSVGGVTTPANWGHFVTTMVGPDLKLVSHGQVSVRGNTIDIKGDVASEATRQQVLGSLSRAFNSRYTISQALKVDAPNPSQQAALDKTLANRTVQFETGSATLTVAGKQVLDQMAATIRGLDNPFVQIIGNTDNVGDRMANIQLSLMRAMAVKAYLVAQGIPAADLSVSGQGPDNPIASNTTDAGRARNRRIDFRISR